MKSKNKKVLLGILGAATGISGSVIASALIAYDSVFSRYERPDYAITPGLVCYDRIKDRLPRTEFFFPSKKVNLKAYYYASEKKKGLVVMAHGIHAGGDDYLPVVEYLVRHGYDVFSFNYRGTYDSEGDSTVGMCQSLVDLDGAFEYITNRAEYKDMPLFVFGHSWGGYAASSVLALRPQIKACALVAPMNNGATMFAEKGQQYAGKLGTIPKPIFETYQRFLFRKYVEYSGVRGINSTSVPVFIAQGADDKIITYKGQSITAHKSEITNPNVTYCDYFGLQGDHTEIMCSVDAIAYRRETESRLKFLEKEKGEKLTHDEIAEFYSTVDHDRYSAVNEDLMQRIVAVFDGALYTNNAECYPTD